VRVDRESLTDRLYQFFSLGDENQRIIRENRSRKRKAKRFHWYLRWARGLWKRGVRLLPVGVINVSARNWVSHNHREVFGRAKYCLRVQCLKVQLASLWIGL
jgi:hypothetical protein